MIELQFLTMGIGIFVIGALSGASITMIAVKVREWMVVRHRIAWLQENQPHKFLRRNE